MHHNGKEFILVQGLTGAASGLRYATVKLLLLEQKTAQWYKVFVSDTEQL